jgi:hypothetical protein
MADSRETRKQILMSAVEQFLDHLDEEFDGEEDFIGPVVIAAEMESTIDEGAPVSMPTYWCTNENAIWQRGFFECLVDLKRLSSQD